MKKAKKKHEEGRRKDSRKARRSYKRRKGKRRTKRDMIGGKKGRQSIEIDKKKT